MRIDYLRASDDPVVSRVLTKWQGDASSLAFPGARYAPSPSSLPQGDTYQDEDGIVLSSSPIPSVNLEAIQKLFQQHLPDEPWPLIREDETLFPNTTGRATNTFDDDTMGGSCEAPQPYCAIPRKLQYTRTIYGPRQSSLLGMRVSGTRRKGPSSVGNHMYGVSEKTAVPDDCPSNRDSQTLQCVSASAVTNSTQSTANAFSDTSPRVSYSIQPPKRPLQDAAEEHFMQELSGSSSNEPDFTATPNKLSNPKPRPVSLPSGLELSDFSQRSISEGLPAGMNSSLGSGSDETLASETLCPYIPGSFIVNPVHESHTLAVRRSTRTRKESQVQVPSGTPSASGHTLSQRVATLHIHSPGRERGECLTFRRHPIVGTKKKSLLTHKLQQSTASHTQAQRFLARYCRAGTRDTDSNGFAVSLHFPCQDPPVPPLQVRIRREATMEELIGYGLFCFVEQYGNPPHHFYADDRDPDFYLDSQAWALHMVEDGLVDEDYPAIDRSLVTGRFGENEFAICPQSFPQNLTLPPIAVQRPNTSPTRPSAEPLEPSVNSFVQNDSSTLSLQVMVVPNARGMMSVQVPLTATTAYAISSVCRSCHLADPHDYVLLYRDVDELIPLSRPVRVFAHRTDLVLVERTSLPPDSERFTAGSLSATNIPEQPKYKTAMDLISNYKVCLAADPGLFD